MKSHRNMPAAPVLAPRKRCAIYTRKSTDEGLDQEYNSLEAQRDAGLAFVLSQRSEGWTAVQDGYDDGGYSGGNLDRPALKRLMADIEDGRIDIVVVYKIDRLTRSLPDFAKLVEVFDRNGVSFVSVTQQFNTTTSMGRLTLNILLSFAQFEREVTGERIRDKIAASKAKGMWMGGTPPLGYDVVERKLVINEQEADLVRYIFRRYAEHGSAAEIVRELAIEGRTTKAWQTQGGQFREGMVFTDPPYNVNYANSAKDKMRGKDRAILNDNLGDGFYDFLLAALTPTVRHCRGGIYVAMSSSELDVLQAAFRAAGGKWSTFIIWAKNTFTLGRADYQRQYEPILYGWPEGATRHWCGDRDQGDVWNIKKPQKNDLHPTMKPVELVERAIRNSSRPDNVVLDPFGGSGTTLIAAEKSGRSARLIELDPKYVDVIVRRWEEFTGKQATREADGALLDQATSDSSTISQ